MFESRNRHFSCLLGGLCGGRENW